MASPVRYEGATAISMGPESAPYSGGAEGDRTPDLLLAKQALSQLSYCPDSVNQNGRRQGSRSKSEVKIVGKRDGGPKWNCTTDPRVISTVLY